MIDRSCEVTVSLNGEESMIQWRLNVLKWSVDVDDTLVDDLIKLTLRVPSLQSRDSEQAKNDTSLSNK